MDVRPHIRTIQSDTRTPREFWDNNIELRVTGNQFHIKSSPHWFGLRLHIVLGDAYGKQWGHSKPTPCLEDTAVVAQLPLTLWVWETCEVGDDHKPLGFSGTVVGHFFARGYVWTSSDHPRPEKNLDLQVTQVTVSWCRMMPGTRGISYSRMGMGQPENGNAKLVYRTNDQVLR